MRIILSVALLFLSTLSSFAQKYDSSIIPDSLCGTDVNTVVRNYDIVVDVKSDSKATTSIDYAITLLKKDNNDDAGFVCNVSEFESLKSFTGYIYDSKGELIKKIKKDDLRYTQYSSQNLAFDQAYYYYTPSLPLYPATIEVVSKKFVPSYLPFSPFFGYGIAVEHYSYSLQVPEDFQIRFKPINTNWEFKNSSVDGGGCLYSLSCGGLKARKKEAFMPPSTDVLPMIFISPMSFKYDNSTVNMSNWQQCGE